MLRLGRADAPGVRILADIRGAIVQRMDVADSTSLFTARAFQPCDRLAVIVDTTLSKMQMRRSLKSAVTAVFLSAEEARAWLLSDREPVAAVGAPR